MPSLLDYDFASPLPHPGETLREHLMIALGLTAETLAGHLGLADPGRIRRIADELEPMTPDLALRLERVFGMDAQTWMALQAQHDLSRETIALRHQLVGLARIETDLAAAIPSWSDPDDAPAWSTEQFARAELRIGEKMIRPAKGTLTRAAPIASEDEYVAALIEARKYFEAEPAADTPEAAAFDDLVGRIEAYEATRCPELAERFVPEHIDTPAEIGRARQEIADGARPRKGRFKL